MLFCVGSNGASTLYFSDPYTYFDAGEIPGAKNLFDNMIAARLCKPFIAVCIEYRSVSYTDDMAYWQDREQVKQELVQDILPYLIGHYSLYAKSTEREELIRNREHMAFFGSSYGGYICHTAGLMDSFELIGYFGTSSGGWVYNAISSGADASDLPLYYFYASGGSPYLDEYYNGSTGDYSCFLRRSGKLIDGVNGHSGLIEGGNHKAGTWVTALFNFARLSFHGDP
ncbi:MAG: hypothetical protein MJ135_04350, partial [Oscillospiraceae bacterium]|nr:hypothetical protein [Oscillospiraceae bacterium]